MNHWELLNWKYTNNKAKHMCISNDHFVYGSSQWETTLQCNVVSHWLGAYTKWSLLFYGIYCNVYMKARTLQWILTLRNPFDLASVEDEMWRSIRTVVCCRESWRSSTIRFYHWCLLCYQQQRTHCGDISISVVMLIDSNSSSVGWMCKK